MTKQVELLRDRQADENQSKPWLRARRVANPQDEPATLSYIERWIILMANPSESN